MSDTPRTDAEAQKSRPPFAFVTRKYAEQLERELNAANAELERERIRLAACGVVAEGSRHILDCGSPCPQMEGGTMSETPKLCQSCAAIVEESGLHFVECGGIQNGLKTSPQVWRLRPKNEAIREAQITKDLQRLSEVERKLNQLREALEKISNLSSTTCLSFEAQSFKATSISCFALAEVDKKNNENIII